MGTYWERRPGPKRHPRLYAIKRAAGGAYRFYADFRNIGGRREALVVPGEKIATDDLAIAVELVVKREAELREQRIRRVHGQPDPITLAEYAREYLIARARAGRVTDRWLTAVERYLTRAITHFGADRELSTIAAPDVRRWLEQLHGSGGTRRHHLNALSSLYRYAASEHRVAPGYNPVAALVEKPRAHPAEARWLEVHEAARLLASARTYVPAPHIYPLLGLFLLTGGRSAEVLGLTVDDVDLERGTVTFREQPHRRLKTAGSARVVPLWPQLREILEPWLLAPDRLPLRGPMFSGYLGNEKRLNKLLDQVATRGGWKAGEIRSKMFRHTYCAARLQTLDHGAPVSPYTVSKELGHGSLMMVEKVYSHLGTIRHRAEVVEYHGAS